MSQNSLLLVVDAWDLCLNAAGDIAMCTPPYSRAQTVANACRLFLGELWYDTTKGVPYFEQVLGRAPPVTFFEAEMVRAALTVPGVVSAQCTIQGINDRTLTGQITFEADDGTTGTVQLASI